MNKPGTNFSLCQSRKSFSINGYAKKSFFRNKVEELEPNFRQCFLTTKFCTIVTISLAAAFTRD